MKITVEFESMDEFEAFKVSGKKTRGKKDEDGPAAEPQPLIGSVPAPLQPPSTFNPSGFAPPAAGATQAAPAFPAAAAPGPEPAVVALVEKINARLSAIPITDQAIAWFRSELVKHGLDAAQATMDQIKAVHLPKLSVPALEGIAKLVGCP